MPYAIMENLVKTIKQKLHYSTKITLSSISLLRKPYLVLDLYSRITIFFQVLASPSSVHNSCSAVNLSAPKMSSLARRVAAPRGLSRLLRGVPKGNVGLVAARLMSDDISVTPKPWNYIWKPGKDGCISN